MGKILSAKLGALFYPVGSDELLQVGVDFVVWGFTLDDEYCDEGPISRDPTVLIKKLTEIQHACDTPECSMSDDRYVLAMQDLRRRIDRYSNPVHAGRFVDAIRTYMIGEMWKAVNPRPSLNDYVLMRLYGGGAWAYPVLAHIIAGIDISQEEYEDRRVHALAQIIGTICALDTDPFSYVKERSRSGEKEHDVITVIQRQFNYSFEQAIDHYLEMRAQALSLFLRLRDDVYATASPAVRAYIESQVLYYAGGEHWTQSTYRYSPSGLDISDEFVRGGFVNAPVQERFESWGLPSMEWWWEYDPARTAGQAGDRRTA
ncbi:hypothetical protein WS70_22005 [Burkholderia mayonis]|uniref:Terpene synthase n=1 Tax=Burkholderia mayonis TaxID=1385591 RepID=A0A1B4FLF0_9BURK|nr:hypothetical protein WS70_22005 [Burkholderia mayonis]